MTRLLQLWIHGRRIAVLAAVLLAPAARAAPPDAVTATANANAANAANAKALRAEATKLFKQKKYAAACDKFQAAVAAAPEDAALLTDLALCQQKLDKKVEATASNLRAIELASRDGKSIDDPAAARERRHAYFNLDQLGASLTHGLTQDGECQALAAPAGCAATFHACAYIDTRGVGRQRQFDRRTMKLGLTPADAAWTKDVRSSEEDDQPSTVQLTQPSPPVPEKVEGWRTVITYYELEPPQHVCDYDQWSCEKSDAVQAAARACLTAAGLALKPNELIQETPCFDKLCRALDKKPSKAVLREKRRAQKNADRCESDASSDQGITYACSIVYANACTGLLGVVCDSDDVEVRGKPAVRVEEFRFVRGK